MFIDENIAKTIDEMFDDRGYCCIETTDRFKKYLTEKDKFALLVVIESYSEIKTFEEFIENPDYETIFFIYLGNVTVAQTGYEKNFDYKIEIHPWETLLVNVTKHFLQPHVEVIKNYTGFGKIPKINFYDPMVRYYRFKKKDILKITSKVTGNVHYRIVV